MIELEILFASGQGIIVPMEDRESALRFMKHAMDARHDERLGLFHLSTIYDEILIDLHDIRFLRIKKENVPLIGATLKLPAVSATRLQQDANTHDGVSQPAASETAPEEAAAAHPKAKPESEGLDPLQAEYDTLQAQLQKAEQQFHKAEERLKKIEQQCQRVEEQMRQERQALEDSAREARLKTSLEAIEIDQEISRMKEKPQA